MEKRQEVLEMSFSYTPLYNPPFKFLSQRI